MKNESLLSTFNREGKTIEEVAAVRWGSLENFKKLLDKAEGGGTSDRDQNRGRQRRSRSRSPGFKCYKTLVFVCLSLTLRTDNPEFCHLCIHFSPSMTSASKGSTCKSVERRKDRLVELKTLPTNIRLNTKSVLGIYAITYKSWYREY